jgi:hypothetical protein
MSKPGEYAYTPIKLSTSLDEKLNLYALAASAAGVSLLALAQPAEAKIVYTKTHHVIGTNGVYTLDLNHDGIADFLLLESGTPTFNGTRASNTLRVKEALGNAVEGKLSSNRLAASALTAGARIGLHAAFVKGGAYGETMAATWASDCGGGPAGQWPNVTNRYLGLKFKIDGKNHYGWARMTVQLPGNFLINATLTGYAYETIPGKAIRAGQTADKAEGSAVSLGSLAVGASGASHRR